MLGESLELARGIGAVESSGRINNSLAYAYYEMGFMERSRSLVEDAFSSLIAANYGRGLRNAYQLTANIGRYQGDYESMRVSRQKQAAYLTSNVDKAFHRYDLAIDTLVSWNKRWQPQNENC